MRLDSLCVCVWERPKHLTSVFQGIYNYAEPPYEVVVVDDASQNQEVPNLVLHFKKLFEDRGISFTFHRNEKNIKHAASQNKAWDLAKGDILFHIEDDILLSKGFNTKLSKTLLDHPEVGQVVPEDSIRGEWIPWPWYNEGAWALGGAFAVRREVYEKVGGWAEFLCLSGDTKIPLLNGKLMTLKELSKLNSWDGLYTYSLNLEKKIVAGKINKVWKNGNKKILKIVFDNGESLKCTEDHKIMLRSGDFIESKNLKVGDSVMPLYRKYKKLTRDPRNKSLYETVFVPKYDCFIYSHRVIATSKGIKMKGKVVHHKDWNSLNNNPDNLMILSSSEHTKIHMVSPGEAHRRGLKAAETMKTNMAWQKNVRLGLKKVWALHKNTAIKNSLISYPIEDRVKKMCEALKDPEVCRLRAEKSKKTLAGYSEEQKKIIWENRSQASKKFWKRRSSEERKILGERIGSSNRKRWERMSIQEREIAVAKIKNSPRPNWWETASEEAKSERRKKASISATKKLKEFYSRATLEWKEQKRKKLQQRNHKIIAIEYSDQIEEVYDMEIDNYHNFAVGFSDSSGVFVHNCHQIEPSYNLSVRMAGWRLAGVPGVKMIHLGEGEANETFKRQAMIILGVHTMLRLWNLRFQGAWDYDNLFSMSWDDFPPNVNFRRRLAAWYASEAQKLEDRYRGLNSLKNDPHYANAVPVEVQKAHQDLKHCELNSNPEEFVYPGHWGKFELVKVIRPKGREREPELIQLMKNNHVFKDCYRLPQALKDLAKRMNYPLTEDELQNLLKSVPVDFTWKEIPIY